MTKAYSLVGCLWKIAEIAVENLWKGCGKVERIIRIIKSFTAMRI
jgi:hypothetical protein